MSYTPQPGTVPYRVIAHLRALPAGVELCSIELAEALEVESGGLSSQLKRSIQFDYVKMRVGSRAGRAMNFFSLGSAKDDLLPDVEPEAVPVNQSTVAALSAPSIFAYASQIDAAPFSVSLSSDGRIVMERYGRTVLSLAKGESRILVDWIDKNLERFIPNPAAEVA